MVIKVKVSDVAAGFGVQNKEVLDLLAQCGAAKKSPSTVLEEGELNALFDRITKTHSVENFDKFYALRSNKPKSQAPQQKKEKKPQSAGNTEKDKKRQSQAAILQMAEQAAKRAEEKAKKKANQTPQARTKGETRHVDTRVNNVDLEKYNQKYEDIAPASNMGDYQKKQKLNQKSKQYRKKRPQGMRARSKRETEAQRLARIAEQRKKQQITIKVPEEITVGELASLLRMTATEVIKKLMSLGVMASVNEVIDYDTAEIVATELGAKVEKQVVVSIEEQIIEEDDENDENAVKRPPVVCVMGHVDHGKTSILDAIRHTDVTSTEAGGITQHIGAYQVEANGEKITFLDTPGHAAFTAMRARGAMATDIAVLVVAADDGIMPQTIEAINHAKAAGVEIIVAINKMDKEGANPDRVLQQLTEHELVPEEWGGNVICVPVSAKTKMGIDKLLETILLVAEMQELKANPDRSAKGTVIEAKLDKGRGPIATLLVQNGTLHAGEGRNVIAAHADMEVEVRGENEAINRELAREAVTRAQGCAMAFGVKMSHKIMGEAVDFVPDDGIVQMITVCARRARHVREVRPSVPLNGSDDATLMIRRVQSQGGRAGYFLVGAGLEASHEHAAVDFDERYLVTLYDIFANLVIGLSGNW